MTAARVIRAQLIGSNCCSAAGLIAHNHAPVLALCKLLVRGGFDPDHSLIAYRRGTVALRVRSIGEAARLTVKTAGNGAPMFAPDGGCKGAAGPSIAPKPMATAGALP
jgi:hypothetical protein